MNATMNFSAFFLLGLMVAAAYATCLSEYSKIAPDHTMCLSDVGTDIPLTPSEKTDVVNRHNKYRQEVAGGATNMQKLIWDDGLATVAAKWARQCKFGHDRYTQRQLPGLPGVTIGQNVGMGYSSVLSAVDDWAKEITDFNYGVRTDRETGHYIQVVFAGTARVGCGQAQCGETSYQVCNYAPGKNGFRVDMYPYNQGPSCSACNGRCDSSQTLCDCEGKVCYNEGELNLYTCACQCPRGFSGDLCQSKICPGSDTPECPDWIAQLGSPAEICRYDNVKKEVCMYTCGFCP